MDFGKRGNLIWVEDLAYALLGVGRRGRGVKVGSGPGARQGSPGHATPLISPIPPVAEDAAGYARLRDLLGAPTDALVVLEATGHYWQNLVATLAVAGFRIAVVNPLRTQRFAEEVTPRTVSRQNRFGTIPVQTPNHTAA